MSQFLSLSRRHQEQAQDDGARDAGKEKTSTRIHTGIVKNFLIWDKGILRRSRNRGIISPCPCSNGLRVRNGSQQLGKFAVGNHILLRFVVNRKQKNRRFVRDKIGNHPRTAGFSPSFGRNRQPNLITLMTERSAARRILFQTPRRVTVSLL